MDEFLKIELKSNMILLFWFRLLSQGLTISVPKGRSRGNQLFLKENNGAQGRNRTTDTRIFSRMYIFVT